MKKTLLFWVAITLFLSGNLFAQTLINVGTYRHNAANTGPIGVTTTLLISANGTSLDNVASAVTDIGFNFWFAGTLYTQFSVSENGLMTLGSVQISATDVNNNMASGTTLPKIAAYWDDLATGSNGYVNYGYSGTSPNRVLCVNWFVAVPKTNATANAMIQAQLYEATGSIHFVFGATYPPANAAGYTMGIGVSAADFASVTVTGNTSATAAYGVSKDNNTLAPGSGSVKRYQFSADYTAPAFITPTAIANAPGIQNRTMTSGINDLVPATGTGVPTTGSLVPRIYYKRSTDPTYVSNPGVLASGTSTQGTWTFTVDHSLLTGGTANPGDLIQYFLIAQDQSVALGHPNISSYPTGVVAADVNTITTPPTSPNVYLIGSTLSGTKTVGTGGDFTSLTLSGGLFDQINAGQLTGNLTVNITSDLTAETGIKSLNAWANGPGGPFTVTINPVGNRIISGATINGGTANLISLIGVTGLTIDGLNSGGNSLTITQTGQYLVGSAVDLKGASNNTITNVSINGYGASNYAISITNSTLPSSNNNISNCRLSTYLLAPSNCGNGIGLLGSATLAGDNNKIENNTIFNFVYYHITLTGKYTNTQISGNDFYNTVGTSNNDWYGIVYIATVSGGGTTAVFNNKIHDILTNGNSSGTGSPAIYSNAAAGTTTNIYNNEINLEVSNNPLVTRYGIKTNGTGAVNIYYNSIYLGGTGITAGNSYGISREGTGTTNILNNVVYNARSNASGTGKNYGIYVTSTSLLTSNYNDIYTPGTGGTLGFSVSDRTALIDWQIATSQDDYSYSANPGFTSTTNLLPNPLNPNSAILDNHGVPVSTISTDILGNTRSTSMPMLTDIGAYENANYSSADIFSPKISSFTPIADTNLTTNQTITATITDGIGVSGGANLPRIYFKKTSDANVFGGNTSSDNGWKYTLATNTTSPYSFTLDYSIINGGTVSPGDAILYFIMAQDDAGNYVSRAPRVVANTVDPVQNVTAAPLASTLNAYLILNNNISGTITVPGNYASLTGTAGLFDAMNKGTVTGNITVQITDNLVETGIVALNQFAVPFTMAIVPANASLKTITGNVDQGLIRFNGADNVTIDGRFAGSGKYLEFLNTSTLVSSSNATFLFVNAATYNTIKYTSIKTQGYVGVSFYGITPYSGLNNYNTIDNCDISGTGSGSTVAGIYSYSNMPTMFSYNQYNTISNCNISNFSTYGIGLATGNSDWTITGNSLYQTATITSGATSYGISAAGTNGSNFVISNNYIGGSAPNAGGIPWTVTSSAGAFYGMYFLTNTTTPAFSGIVTNNKITNLDLTSSNYYGFYGIYLSSSANSGLFTITGNTIGSSSIADAIVIKGTNTQNTGIAKIGNGLSINFSNNTIGGITSLKSFDGINFSSSTPGIHTINGNIIGSTTIANSIKLGDATTSVSFTGIYNSSSVANSISNNTIANITNLYAGTSASTIKGLYFSGTGAATVNGNSIFNLISNSAQSGTLASASVIGIHKIATTAACSINQNTIYGLENKSATGIVNIAGISITSASGSVTAARNYIYGLSLSTVETNASITGIYAGGGLSNFQNNVIQLGTNANGADINAGYAINGIHNNGGTNYYYFNTLNIKGSNVTGTTAPTYSLNGGTAVTNLQDNNLVNTRSGGVTGKHYALKLASVPTTMDNNNYFVSGGTGFLAMLGTTGYTDFATWQSTAVSGKDVLSLNVNPLFLSPADPIPSNSSLTAAGVAIAGIITDYLGATRSATPTIGAYETVAVCTSPTSGGTIVSPEVVVGCDPFNPTIILSSAVASGQSGLLNYVWQQSTTDALTGFTDIANSDAESYDPGDLTVTTWFKRLAKAYCDADFSTAQESNVVLITVNPLTGDAGPITGSGTLVLGATAVPYAVTPIANATAYIWSYSGTGATINGTGTDVTIDFAIDATEGTLSVKGSNSCGEGLASTLDILSFKTLNLKVMLQGLWNSTNMNMDVSKMADGTTPNFTAPIADTISVELHDAASYGTIVLQIHGLELNQDGTVYTTGKSFVEVPSALSGSYYITIKTRNHVGTTSAVAVSFAGSIIDYDFSTAATQAYGSNEVLLSTGIYGLYAGELNKDGFINILDRELLLIDLNAALAGYNSNDLNGDGFVNIVDRELLLINLNAAVSSILPIP